ncbi:uncharacterized protein SOCE26_097200 [Sorangium cellulosum]|uniref:Secreted protein n=1 Tax=Sorangium cellulosum TaxID=56 RepID=A0A2L0F9R5_SORCE|nr:hypothetical protein [Sorangium cellulosum]AUX48189.1 uncharacterized protein SOCE26_097200 [Sorangium cellulosum]
MKKTLGSFLSLAGMALGALVAFSPEAHATEPEQCDVEEHGLDQDDADQYDADELDEYDTNELDDLDADDPVIESSEAALRAHSYERTCWDMQWRRGTLCASCRTRAGGWERSCLPRASRCRGDISNQNGWLVCGRW